MIKQQNISETSSLNAKDVTKKFIAGLSLVPIAIFCRSFLTPLMLPPNAPYLTNPEMTKISFTTLRIQTIFSFLFPLKDLYYQMFFSSKQNSTIQSLETTQKSIKLGHYYSGGLAGFTIWAINSPSEYSRLKQFGRFDAKNLLITSMLSISSLRCIYFGAYASIKNYTIQNYYNWNIYYSILASSIATLGMKIAQIPFKNYRTKNYSTFGFLGVDTFCQCDIQIYFCVYQITQNFFTYLIGFEQSEYFSECDLFSSI